MYCDIDIYYNIMIYATVAEYSMYDTMCFYWRAIAHIFGIYFFNGKPVSQWSIYLHCPLYNENIYDIDFMRSQIPHILVEIRPILVLAVALSTM